MNYDIQKITRVVMSVVAVSVIMRGILGLFFTRFEQPAVFIAIVLAALFHDTPIYRLRHFLIYFAIVFVISNIVENTAIIYGGYSDSPGPYYYSDLLGPKLFNIPLLVAPSCFATGYFGSVIVRILVGAYEYRPRGVDVWCLSPR